VVDPLWREGAGDLWRARPERESRSVRGVAELIGDVTRVLAAGLGSSAVRGEVSAFMRASSGHCYFTLKDAEGRSATLRCAMFRRAANLLDFVPSDGQLVDLRGRIGVYEPRGELQFVVEGMRRAGEGALYERFLRLRAQLEAQGLFDAAHKRALPLYPRRVGVVTSPDGAALHDVLTCLARRAPHVAVVLYPSLVQGSEAPDALCRAIATAGRRAEVETLIVCRGGGSLEDLWSFNDECVVRAIAASPIPVLSGVGHETDTTLADLAADARAATPTAAAEIVTPTRGDCLDQLDSTRRVLRDCVARRLDTQEQRLDRVAVRLLRPGQAIHRQGQQLHAIAGRLLGIVDAAQHRHAVRLHQLQVNLARAATRLVDSRRQNAETQAHRLRALDPQNVLRRGYAWLTDEADRAIVSVRALEPGRRIKAVLSDGLVGATVTDRVGRNIDTESPSD